MNILVTGSRGFIGRAVCAEIELREHTWAGFDLPWDDVSAERAFDHLAGDTFHGIINLAGRLGTEELFGAEAVAAQANIIGAINVYDFAAAHQIPVVQIGTGHKGQPNPYAITKACAEDLGLARARWCGEKIIVVRAYHVYGPGQTPGPPYGMASVHKFFPTFACQALNREPLDLCGGGGQLIDPVSVYDVAELLVDALDFEPGVVYQAGNGKPVTVRQVAGDIRDVAVKMDGPKPTFAHTVPVLRDAPGRPGEPMGAEVVAQTPMCQNPWPYRLEETVAWYRDFLAGLVQ